MIYLNLWKKMTKPMLGVDQRWVFENFNVKSVETLRECWMIQESQFPTRVHQTIKGLAKGEGRPDAQAHGTTVPVCRNIIMRFHNCEMFGKMDAPCRWDAKRS